MKLRDERYWLGVSPWVFVPFFLALACGPALLIEPPWLRVPVQALALGVWFTYVTNSPWAGRWGRLRRSSSRWRGGQPTERRR
ncbi:hypothetical protein [Blastococcus sp. LR1]|uniref:hypothetical protein n=1 Tax=Blastococcus sp. LR1 TaxID=2877000 RepID=UPI001CC927B0|nr:hypothetical protein [Blastococcus sp. LR1]MCA0143472.1 hypothetical protein [Blastococcus sp. LR1]